VVLIGAVASWAFTRTDHESTEALDAAEGWRAFQTEFDRARRHERPLALLRLPQPGPDAAWADRRALLSRRLRSSDRTWVDGDEVFALLIETDATGAAASLSRLRRAAPELFGESTAASFPADGVTTGALVSAVFDRPVAQAVGPGFATAMPVVPHVAEGPEGRTQRAS
jgi:hypothetical protein